LNVRVLSIEGTLRNLMWWKLRWSGIY